MKKRRLIILVILFIGILLNISLIAKGQKFSCGIKAAGNYPMFSELKKTVQVSNQLFSIEGINETMIITENYEEKAGGSLTFDVAYHISKNLYVSSGIGARLINFKRTIKAERPDVNSFHTFTNYDSKEGYAIFDYYKQTNAYYAYYLNNDDNIFINYSDNLGTTSIMYFNLPVKLGYEFLNKRLAVDAGLMTSFVVYSQQSILKADYQQIVEYDDKSSTGLNNTLFAVEAGISYKLVQNLYFTTQFSKYLNAIYDTDYQEAGKAKYNLITAGIRYGF